MDTGIEYSLELAFNKNTYQTILCSYCWYKLAINYSHSQNLEVDLISYTVHGIEKKKNKPNALKKPTHC